MPIRINLLAEMQALEEVRRKDPVKRAVIVAVAIVVVVLLYISLLVVKKIGSNSELAALEQRIESGTQEYRQVLDNQQNLVEGRQKLVSLHQLSTNRFLMGNMLEALQHSSVDNVLLTRLKIDQVYSMTEATKSVTNEETGVVASGKPANSVEKTTLVLNAKDTSSAPGDTIGKYQTALSHNSFFRPLITNRTNDFRLTTSLTPQSDADGKNYVAFTLEAHLPDKSR